MILGFAHLALNVDDLDAAEREWLGRGYTRGARHSAVTNHPDKRAFANRFVTQHDLLLLRGPELWPLELTHHGPTSGQNTQLIWGREAIDLRVPDVDAVTRLLSSGLGFREKDSPGAPTVTEWELASRLPGWGCRLRLQRGADAPSRLDASGPTCLAFYCNRIDEDLRVLQTFGAVDATNVFNLTLAERVLSIAMARLPNGPLVELIQPKTRTP